MNVTFVMTIIGADRPGLVGELSAVIADHDGNWLASRMSHLGGQFAGIVQAQVPAAREQQFLAALQALKTHGIAVSVQKDNSPALPELQLATIEVVGHDRPGIVRQITQILAQQQVNIEELTTACESAPMSGEELFHATAQVQLPATGELRQLQQALEQIASDLMVDIQIRSN